MARRAVKLVHTLGAIGLTGAIAAYMVLLANAPDDSLEAYARVRESIRQISQWLVIPSLGIVMTSGLLSMAVHTPFLDARWVWAKALLGLPTFEGTLLTVDATAQRAARLSAEALAGETDPALVAKLLENEWWGLWWIMTLVVASTAIGVWRPRLRRRPARKTAPR